MTLYEKRGRRYFPVHDTNALDGLSNGHWMISIEDGSRSCQRVVEPDLAGFLAAAQIARDAMCQQLIKSSVLTPRDPIWRDLLGNEVVRLDGKCAFDIAEAGIAAVAEAYRKEKGE